MNRLTPCILTLTILVALVLSSSLGVAGPLPPLIDFQSVLLDEGGNLLPSGTTAIQFQILDENHTPIYTETQSVDVVKGAAAALIGNGADAKGITTGGVPDDIFATGAPRYLQVQVEGHAAEDPMTIVPVPYAQWSQTCATVADGAVTPAALAKAAVGFESLAPDVVSRLAEEMSKSQGVVTMQALSSSGGATQVGVDAKLINSGSTSVQGALQDIDLAVKKRQEETTFLTGKLNEEVTNSTNAVAGVQGQITKEVSDRGVAITQEQQTRSGADTVLQGQITKEITDRATADSGLQIQITGEAATRAGQVDTINTTISNINNVTGSLSSNKLSIETDLNMNTHKVTNLAPPTTNTDAATKFYVDGEIASVTQAGADIIVGLLKMEEGSFVGDGKNRTITLPTITKLKQVHIISDGAGIGGLTFWRMEDNRVLTWGISQNGPFAANNGNPDGGAISATPKTFTISNSQWNALGFTTYWIALGQ